MSKHTPGPWSIGSIDVGRGVIRPAIYGPDNVKIAECFGDNADLIVAAPEMLEVLRAIVASNDRYWDEPFMDSHNAARALLSKLEG